MDFNQLKESLLKLDTACICDANKNLRVLDPHIRPIQSGLKLIGIAHTVICRDDFLTVIQALKEAQAGEVLVIDNQGSPRAVVGELFSTEALRKGLAGIVIDGACRDVQKLRTLHIPVYARYTSPLAGTTSKIFDTQVPITCGGVIVHPGDIVFGDDDGVVIASLREWSEALPIAQWIQAKEGLVLKRMEHQESLLDMLNFEEHYRNVSDNQPSSLKFTL